jgi:hypothetical protein
LQLSFASLRVGVGGIRTARNGKILVSSRRLKTNGKNRFKH